jgi:hypothetical protein
MEAASPKHIEMLISESFSSCDLQRIIFRARRAEDCFLPFLAPSGIADGSVVSARLITKAQVHYIRSKFLYTDSNK